VTKGEAEATLGKCELLRPVAVADLTKDGKARRSFTFPNPNGAGTCSVEIDADPSKEQLEDLARHLPVPEEKRVETAAVLVTDAKLPAEGIK
jgi:hypothetical protein